MIISLFSAQPTDTSTGNKGGRKRPMKILKAYRSEAWDPNETQSAQSDDSDTQAK